MRIGSALMAEPYERCDYPLGGGMARAGSHLDVVVTEEEFERLFDSGETGELLNWDNAVVRPPLLPSEPAFAFKQPKRPG